MTAKKKRETEVKTFQDVRVFCENKRKKEEKKNTWFPFTCPPASTSIRWPRVAFVSTFAGGDAAVSGVSLWSSSRPLVSSFLLHRQQVSLSPAAA